MLTFETHPQDVSEMKRAINSGKFHSVYFIKADGSIRKANGKKLIYTSSSPDEERRGKFDRKEKNILTIFDNNKEVTDSQRQPVINPNTGKPYKGAPISIRLDRLLFFKSGPLYRDFTEENKDAIINAGITPDEITKLRRDIKGAPEDGPSDAGDSSVMNEGFDYQKKLGQVVASTQQIIDKAKVDDIIAIEPDSTWETMYEFDKVVLMNTRLKVFYEENNGRGWEKKVDEVNLTQDRNIGFQDSKAILSWIRRAIKKGYTQERQDSIKQDKLNQM